MTGRRISGQVPAASGWRFAWRDCWSELRNRLLASHRFQFWASRFPLTRPVARRRARAAFDLCAGFVYSQVLFACVQLRLFDALADGPEELAVLAREMGLARDRAAILLDAAVALELLELRGPERYGLGSLGAVMASNGGICAMVRHHSLFYEDLKDPVALLQNESTRTRLGQYWPYAGTGRATELKGDAVSAYSDLMADSQAMIAAEVLSAYSLRGRHCLLDVGGGAGAFLAAVGQRWPHLQLMLFDLPAVADQARLRLGAQSDKLRLQLFSGDFFNDPLPTGADVVSLIRVLHDHDDDDALRLLQAVYRCLPPGGVLLLGEPMDGHQDAARVARAYFGLYLLAMGKGRPRTPGEIGYLLTAAGFKQQRLLSNGMPLQTQVMVAFK